jgi:hypothetical protein
VRVGHDGSLGCKRVQVRSGTGTGFCFVLNSKFCFKADSAHWERIMLLLGSRRFKDDRWQR